MSEGRLKKRDDAAKFQRSRVSARLVARTSRPRPYEAQHAPLHARISSRA